MSAWLPMTRASVMCVMMISLSRHAFGGATVVDGLLVKICRANAASSSQAPSAASNSGNATVAKPIAASAIPYGNTNVSAWTSAPHE